MIPDLNCDLGENERPALTRALISSVTSVNIACGGHAGELNSMRRCIREALKHNVRIGAHPGLNDRSNFGRAGTNITPQALETLLLQQISALEKIAVSEGAALHHVKLHGALYHLTETEPRLRRACLSTMKTFWPNLIIFARAGGKVAAAAKKFGLKIWPEGFLDRRYLPDGNLVPRTEPNAVLSRLEFLERLEAIARNNSPTLVPVRTWCLHSDTPGVVRFAQLAKRKLMSGQ